MIFDASAWSLGGELLSAELARVGGSATAQGSPAQLGSATSGEACTDEVLPSFAEALLESQREPNVGGASEGVAVAPDAKVTATDEGGADEEQALDVATDVDGASVFMTSGLVALVPSEAVGARPADAALRVQGRGTTGLTPSTSLPAGASTPNPHDGAPARLGGASTGEAPPAGVEADGEVTAESSGNEWQMLVRAHTQGHGAERATELTRVEHVAARLATLVDRLEKAADAQPAQRQRTEVELRLDPPELGELVARIQVHRREVQVTIHAQDAEAARAIAREAAVLKVQLAEHGFSLARFDVATGGGDTGGRDARHDAAREQHAELAAARAEVAGNARGTTERAAREAAGPRLKRGVLDVVG